MTQFSSLKFHLNILADWLENPSSQSLERCIGMLQVRIDAEEAYIIGLRKTQQYTVSNINEKDEIRCPSLEKALDTMLCDFRNDAEQREMFVKELKTEVLEPLLNMKKLFKRMNHKFTNQGRNTIKNLNQIQIQYHKKDKKYLQLLNYGKQIRIKLINPIITEITKNKFAKQLIEHEEQRKLFEHEFDDLRTNLRSQEMIFEDTMNIVMEGLQSNEQAKIITIKEVLRKFVIFLISLGANRTYDSTPLASEMECIDYKSDIEIITNKFIILNPNTTINPITSIKVKNPIPSIIFFISNHWISENINISLLINQVHRFENLLLLSFVNNTLSNSNQLEMRNIFNESNLEFGFILLSSLKHVILCCGSKHNIILIKESFDFLLNLIDFAIIQLFSQYQAPILALFLLFLTNKILLLHLPNDPHLQQGNGSSTRSNSSTSSGYFTSISLLKKTKTNILPIENKKESISITSIIIQRMNSINHDDCDDSDCNNDDNHMMIQIIQWWNEFLSSPNLNNQQNEEKDILGSGIYEEKINTMKDLVIKELFTCLDRDTIKYIQEDIPSFVEFLLQQTSSYIE